MKLKFLLFAVATMGLLQGCSKDEGTGTPEPVSEKGNVTMKFENYVGSQPLSLDKGTSVYGYTNANNDQFNVKVYKYYVSNVRFVNSNGSEYAEQESYHLINQAESASLNFDVTGLPAGTYTSVKILLGVDSLRNVSGAQTGALDPIHGMFWTWASGYIMAKVEGSYKHGTTGDNTTISFHLGGFQGQYSVLQEVTLPLPQQLVVGNNTKSSIILKSDILKWFEAPHMIKFDELNLVNMFGEDAYMVSQNYRHSLSVTAVQN